MPDDGNAKPFDLVLVGAISKDENIYGHQRENSIGGAVTYGAFAAKRSGGRVGVVTKLSEQDTHLTARFADDGIPVWVVPSKRTTAIRNVYHSADREKRTCTCLEAVDAFTPASLPDITTRIVHAAALISGEIPLQTLKAMARLGQVGLDVQGFLRVNRDTELVFEKSDEAEQAIQSVTYLKADAAEAEILTSKTDLAEAALDLADRGPAEVVISHNTQLVLAYRKKIFTAPLTPRGTDGRTGRGDTLFCSYLARRAQGDEPPRALKFAAALVSLKLETPGPFKGTMADVLMKMKSG